MIFKEKIKTILKQMNMMIFIKKNMLYIVIFWILLTIISPYIFTLKFNIIDFTETGQIGDTIGGITSPIINILNAILIYIAFTEQLNANNILKDQIDVEKKKEIERLSNIKELVLFDLKNNILPNLDKISKDCSKYIKAKQNGEQIIVNDFVDFNDNIFQNISHADLLKIFEDDFQSIMFIYNRVKFISSNTPLKISHQYPTDKFGLRLIKLTDNEKTKLISNHNEKIKTVLKSLIEITIPNVRTTIKWVTEKEEIFDNTEKFSGL